MPIKLKTDENVVADITCIISDVDGVLTDGKITYDENNVETKQFSVRDGLGIKKWMESGFDFAILSARTSKVVDIRVKQLGITAVKQGFMDKWPAAQEIMQGFGCSPQQVCYIGDDLPDIPVMRQVGLAVAPADACSDARDAAQWVLRTKGGEGAVREMIERILRAKGRWEEHLR